MGNGCSLVTHLMTQRPRDFHLIMVSEYNSLHLRVAILKILENAGRIIGPATDRGATPPDLPE